MSYKVVPGFAHDRYPAPSDAMSGAAAPQFMLPGFPRRVPSVPHLRLGSSQGAAPMAYLTSTKQTKTVSGTADFNSTKACEAQW
jgi:hypothetical protein